MDKKKTVAVFKKLASQGSGTSNMLDDLYSGRMAGLHSYNVLDSAAFIETKKIADRIKSFDKKQREKSLRESERLRQSSLLEASAGSRQGLNDSANKSQVQSIHAALEVEGLNSKKA